MSRKSILNLTSVKKRDTMLSWRITNDTEQGQVGSGLVPAAVGGTFVWCATARDLRLGESDFRQAHRAQPSIYCVGLKELMEIQTATDHMWVHRRIIFAIKDVFLQQDAPGAAQTAYENLSNGWARMMKNTRGAPLNTYIAALIFRGKQDVDWNNYHNAPVDNTRVTILRDTKSEFKSGNGQAIRKVVKTWIPIRKTIVYDDDEGLNSDAKVSFSVRSKRGLGDVFIVDYFDCVTPASGGQLVVNPCATMYWHER